MKYITRTNEQMDARYPNRHDPRSQLGKSSPCLMRMHEACKVEECACNCHDGPADGCTAEHPCCDRRDEYNGFASGPLTFVCPKGCACHD